MSLHARGDVYLYAHEALSLTWIHDIFGARGGEISDGGEKGKLLCLPLLEPSRSMSQGVCGSFEVEVVSLGANCNLLLLLSGVSLHG